MKQYYVIVRVYQTNITSPLMYVLICKEKFNFNDYRECYKKQLEELKQELKNEGVKYTSLNVSSPEALINNQIKITNFGRI